MNEPLLVHVVDATADLDEEVESSVLAQVLLTTNQKEQISFAGKFESQVYSFLVFKAGVKSAKVVVV